MSEIEGPFNTACTSRENPLSHARTLSDSGVLLPKSVGLTPELFPIPNLPPLSGIPPDEISLSKTDKLLQALSKENKILRNENTYLKFEAQVREEELVNYRSKYYAENFNASVRKYIIGSISAKPVPLKSFRPPPKFRRHAESGLGEAGSRKGATEAAVPAPSKTVPTVSVTRTDDCPGAMTSIKSSSSAIRDQRVIKTHKPTKRVNLSSTNLDRSGIGSLGYRERKMDDLLKQLKTGSVTLAPTTARISSSTAGSTPSSHVSTSHNRGQNLAPLASQIFKDEVDNSLSRVKRSPAKKLWSVLNEVDINRSSSRIGSYGAKQSIECSGTSAKALGKRKAILLEHPSLNYVIDVRSKPIPNESLESPFRVSNGTIESHLPPLIPETSTTRSAKDPGALCAEKALLSLERICAGFSSGSLGSLESTSDPSSVIDQLVDVPSLFVIDPTVEANELLSVRSRESSGPESPSFSRLSVKTSTPLVSRYNSSSPFRPAATSSPKTMPYSTARTLRKYTSPLHLTKVTDIASSNPTPTKKAFRKHTSPLRVAKKGQGNVSVRPPPVSF
ncbi:hypothetical protein J132_01757 [Termitomyces sp. J132]|nr:hypothetical protein J132_01757 [Termitomyces sp. J132]